MDWRHMAEMLAAGCAAHLDLLNLCVWVKSNGGMGSLYRSSHAMESGLRGIISPFDVSSARKFRHTASRTAAK
jgi:hypothetical protein